ncbi:glutamine synthetase family protein [Gymnodinialimonas sp. 2305UL16-5]|uniref:glutamine synthetase family protein n=1 Tax=Gymnodinialimonas mytili TaxID=3126503 RepID=UPI0030A8B8A9
MKDDRATGDQVAAVLAQVQSAGIETVRLCFVDQHGILRGKTIVAAALPSAFETGIGVPSTLLLKDTSHRTVFPVWTDGLDIADLPLGGAGDVVLRPDPARFFPLPWSPHSAILLCDVRDRMGAEIPFSSNAILARAVAALNAVGYRAVVGLEVEFQVFQRTDSALAHGQATIPPAPIQTANLTQGHQYLTESRYAEVEDLLDHLRRMADGLGLEPRSMEIEMGPSQFEFTFAPSDPQTQADRFVLFRTMVKEVCQMRGLHATFMPKPNLPNAAANGWHIHQSLIRHGDGRNAFTPQPDGALSTEANGWIAGLLKHARATCLMTNPTVNSYKRFTPFQLAPNRVQWGRDNRGAMIRALMYPGDAASRIENRVADTGANPHFAFAAQIFAGLDGLSQGLTAPAPTETPYDEAAEALPNNLLAAIEAFEGSQFTYSALGADVVAYLVKLKRAEWDRYLTTISDWEQQEYFGLF